MKIYVKEKQVVKHYLTGVKCDICGREISVYHGDIDWAEENYMSQTTTVSKFETIDGECDLTEYDICYDCFENVIEKAIKEDKWM